MCRQLVGLFLAACAACGSILKDGHGMMPRRLDSTVGQPEEASSCTWKRVWKANPQDMEVVEVGASSESIVETKGSAISLLVRKNEGVWESGKIKFALSEVTLPQEGKLEIRAQFPKETGTWPKMYLEYGYPPKEVVVAEGNGKYPNALVLHRNASLPTVPIKEFPCIKSFADDVHAFHVAWDKEWIRWYVDDVFYAEAHRNSFISDASELSLKAEIDLDESVDAETQLVIRDIILYEQTGNECLPSLVNPLQCENYKPQVPLVPALRSGSLLNSLNFEEVNTFIDSVGLQLGEFPHLWRKQVIGESVESRPIVALCLGHCHDSKFPVPETLFTALHHSREPMSMMNLVFFIDHLVLGLLQRDTTITQLLHSRALWFILVVNPDGYVYNEKTIAKAKGQLESSFSGQRKNRKPSSCNSKVDLGVDLNRNYDICFNQDSKGSSDEVCAEDYRGVAAFSEPETRAVRDFVQNHSFSAAFNYHSFGKYFNIPFACEPKGVPDAANMAVFNMLAAEMTRWNKFGFGQSWKDSNLYTVNGETSDWMWNAHGIYAMSPETGPKFDVETLQGFWPSSPTEIHTICEELLHSNYVLAKYSGPVYTLGMESWRHDSEKIFLRLSVKNKGLRVSPWLEAIGSVHLSGSNSGPPQEVKVLSAEDPANDEIAPFTLTIPRSATTPLAHVYVVLRDGFSCFFYRISLGRKSDKFLVWEPLVLPQCGTCASFGSTKVSSTVHDCTEVDAELVMVDIQPTFEIKAPHPHDKTTTEATNQPQTTGDNTNTSTTTTSQPQTTRVAKTLPATKETKLSSVGEKHKAPVNEKKALLLISLVVLLGMVVVLMGMRHVKSKQSAKDEYAMVAKTEHEHAEQDNMLVADSPRISLSMDEAHAGSSVHQLDEEASAASLASVCRVRSPPPASRDSEHPVMNEV